MLVIFDTETTRLNDAAIVEIACHITIDNQAFSFEERCMPRHPIEPGAEAIHGISNADVADCRPDTVVIAEWWEELLEMQRSCGQQMVLAGHNTDFDIRAIRQYVKVPGNMPIFDTWPISKDLFKGFENYKLGTVHTSLGLDTNMYNQHEAMSDVLICKDIIELVCKRLNRSYLDIALEYSKPKMLPKCTIGKHKGATWDKIPTNYLQWMVGQDDMKRDLKFSAEQELKFRGVAC